MPKSESFTWPLGATRMLDGLTSRWMMPAPWAADSALAVCARIGAAASGLSRPLSLTSSDRLVPSTYSMTSHCWLCPSVVSSTRSKTATTLAWLSFAASLASRSARRASGVIPPGATPIRLSATVRPSTSSRPRHTAPMPPRPISASSVYLPAITYSPSCQRPRVGVPVEPVGCAGDGWARIVSVPTDAHLLDDLQWRGLVAHSTDLDALREALTGGSVRFYVGFDPTAPSLHMGNLVQILTAKRLQQAGHTPYALVGGATGMIGDPRDSGERVLNPAETVKDWVERVRRQIEPFLDFEGDNAATMVNNLDWTESLSTIDFLRDIGKHFPVNRMLARDVVRSRLEAGISYTEFSYVLLQSMDFLNLYRQHGVTLQFGGSDQWGNLTGGVELIRRAAGGQAHAFATPLLTKADGTKYGKTEGGALWLDPEMLSPYAFYQFWLNQGDAEVGELLRVFTFLSREEIEALEAEHAEKPYLRLAQRTLAEHVTTLVHGAEEARQIQAAAEALFGGGELSGLSAATLAAALAEAGSVQIEAGEELPTVVELLVASGLSASKGEARRTVGEGGAYLNNERVTDPDARPTSSDLLAGGWLVLRRGKKSFAGVEVR